MPNCCVDPEPAEGFFRSPHFQAPDQAILNLLNRYGAILSGSIMWPDYTMKPCNMRQGATL